jgi:hypothetical protein
MLVRAKALLFYGSLVAEGKAFSLLRKEDFDPKVMDMLDEDAPAAPEPADPNAPRPEALSFAAAMQTEANEKAAVKAASDKAAKEAIAAAKAAKANGTAAVTDAALDAAEAAAEGTAAAEREAGQASDVEAFNEQNAPNTPATVISTAPRRRSTAARNGSN